MFVICDWIPFQMLLKSTWTHELRAKMERVKAKRKATTAALKTSDATIFNNDDANTDRGIDGNSGFDDNRGLSIATARFE
jgi:hypothetical protein